MKFSFFRKNEEKERALDESFERVTREIRAIDEWDDPKKIEHYILDSCEQIIATTKEIEAEKNEYRKITNYLNDVTKIEALSGDEKKELREAAAHIEKLRASKQAAQKADRLISDEMFEILSENEEDMPQTIERMMENEAYQDSLHKQIRLFEGEKDRFEIERENHTARKKRMRLFAVLLMLSLVSLFAFLFILQQYVDTDTSWLMFAFVLAVSVVATLLFLRLSTSTRGNKRALRQLNETIAMLNSLRIRYANVTKALQFVQEKFHVRTSYELKYLWAQYEAELRRQDQYLKDDRELEYYMKRFFAVLDELELYEREIWSNKLSAISSDEEMAAFKHTLVEHRKRNRERISDYTRAVSSERDEIDRLMKERDYYIDEIIDIIYSVDRLCGLNRKYDYPTPVSRQKPKTKGKPRAIDFAPKIKKN